MRRTIVFGISALFSVLSYALHVKCVGKAVLLTNDGDTLLLFEKNPELNTLGSVGVVDWYRLPDTINPVQTGTDYFYPEHGEGYMLKIDTLREYFWVFDYDSLRADVNAIVAELTCESTELTLEGNVPQMQYRNQHGKLCTYPRMCTITYSDVQWSNEGQWVDSLAVAEVMFASTSTVGASPVATDFTIVDQLATLLELDDKPLQTSVYEPITIKAHPQAVVTVRGEAGERTNEVERPIDTETTIKRSAPLEIEFRANALNADYHTWEIYKGSEPLLKRNEAQHKYTFEQPGVYSAKVTITNSHGCEYVSEDFEISVSESMLIVPNVFTPNGDGTNDEFRVVYRSIKEFHCQVYNRWGHKVYEWTDPAKGWDGNIGGRPAPEGAYYYVIRALGTDAETDYMAKPKYTKKLKKGEQPLGVYQLSGDINLLRGGK